MSSGNYFDINNSPRWGEVPRRLLAASDRGFFILVGALFYRG